MSSSLRTTELSGWLLLPLQSRVLRLSSNFYKLLDYSTVESFLWQGIFVFHVVLICFLHMCGGYSEGNQDFEQKII